MNLWNVNIEGSDMKRSRFNQELILGILEQREAGAKMADLCKEHNVSPATIYRWRSKFTVLDASEAQRLRQVEDENQRLKQLVADLSLDREALRAVIRRSGSQSFK
jgi:putative transposase